MTNKVAYIYLRKKIINTYGQARQTSRKTSKQTDWAAEVKESSWVAVNVTFKPLSVTYVNFTACRDQRLLADDWWHSLLLLLLQASPSPRQPWRNDTDNHRVPGLVSVTYSRGRLVWCQASTWHTELYFSSRAGLASPVYTVSQKNCEIIFVRTLSNFHYTAKVFSKKMAKRIILRAVHSFSTSPNLCHRTTVLNAYVPNCYIAAI